jgi:hypothetical protein
MQARQSASLHRPIAFGFWFLATCGAAAACSDDGNLLGSENSAGSGGSHAGSGGSRAGSGGSHAGTQTSAGASVVAGAAGSASEGGGSSTGGYAGTPSEGGAAGMGGAGGDAGGAGGGGDCVDETCAANETCVAHRTVGGAVMPPDQNNQCMDGQHLEGSNCLSDFSYTCATLTGCSAPSGTCRCAAGTECAGTTVCRLPSASAWLDTDAQLVCELLAP